MFVEEELFAKRQCKFNELVAYGFSQNGDDYCLEVPLKSANFLAKIRVSSVGEVGGKVYDLDTGDEYLLLRVDSDNGSFSAAVKAEYRAILQILPTSALSRPRQTRFEMKSRADMGMSQISLSKNSPTTPFSVIPRTVSGTAC